MSDYPSDLIRDQVDEQMNSALKRYRTTPDEEIIAEIRFYIDNILDYLDAEYERNNFKD